MSKIYVLHENGGLFKSSARGRAIKAYSSEAMAWGNAKSSPSIDMGGIEVIPYAPVKEESAIEIFLQFIQDKQKEYDEKSTEALRKHGHGKQEYWYSAHMWAFKEAVDEAKKLGLIGGNAESTVVLKTVEKVTPL